MSIPSSQPANRTRKPICIVDDNDAVADSLRGLLTSFGFEVQSYNSGAQFLADERHRTAACLVIDLHMPGMTGLDVLDCLLKEGTRIPSILISGRLDDKLRERATRLGVGEIIEKPLAGARLVELVRMTLAEPN
jgi:FixJ family two-component response regulator